MVFRLGDGAAQIFCHSARADVLWGKRRRRRRRRREEEDGDGMMSVWVRGLSVLVGGGGYPLSG